jgi:hypothetical protein
MAFSPLTDAQKLELEHVVDAWEVFTKGSFIRCRGHNYWLPILFPLSRGVAPPPPEPRHATQRVTLSTAPANIAIVARPA